MVQPLEHFSLHPSGFGGELVIKWHYPDSLPAKHKVYLFKRKSNPVTDEDIQGYFDNINNLQGYNYNGLFVFDKIPQGILAAGDYHVFNDVTYHYSAVLRDEESGEISSKVSASGAPQPNLKISIRDGKDIVAFALEKMADNVRDVTNRKVQIGKDLKIVKHFAVDLIGDNTFFLERINGTTYMRFLGNTLQMYQGRITKGDYDLDVIRVTFLTQVSPERRDQVYNIVRMMKQYLIQICKKEGAINCDLTLEGDYYNPQIHGTDATGFTMVFTLIIENKIQTDMQAGVQLAVNQININQEN